MKKLFNIALLAVAALFLASCDDFLTKDTIASLNSETFFEDETSLQLYANGFIQNMMPSAADIAESNDSYTDVCATRNGLNMFTTVWTSSSQTGWAYSNWTNLFRVNYFLVHLQDVKGVSEAKLAHYEGVARFWRAFFYFYKMRTFGDVPWYDKPIDQNDEEALYKARDSRELIAAKILEDLDFAAANCEANVNTQQADKWKALAYKARFCLYEGSYRKYHSVNPSTNQPWTKDESEFYLGECVKACEEIINEGPFKLNEAVSKTNYKALFTSETCNRSEVIWEREYSKELNFGHEVNWNYWNQNSQRWSMTRIMADMYLRLDGSRYTEKAGYGKELFPAEVADRDYRMAQTIICPGYIKEVSGVKTPYAPNAYGTITGYQIIKYCYDDDTHMSGNNATCIPILRYAEVLLNYAEASCELAGGVLSEDIWNKTVKPLRARAGVSGVKPSKIDSKLAAYYGLTSSDLVEIRRERAVELFMEDTRWNDLMRWNLGHLCVQDWEGIYIPGENVLMDLNDDGVDDTCYGTGSADGVTYFDPSQTAYKLSADNHLVYEVKRTWEDKMYLRPIPHTANSINPALGQNYGWTD